MFAKKTNTATAEDLQKEIDRTIATMETTDPGTAAYSTLADQLGQLYTLKSRANGKDEEWRVSPDTLATIGANIAGILLIISYERVHVVTSKALSFVMKSAR